MNAGKDLIIAEKEYPPIVPRLSEFALMSSLLEILFNIHSDEGLNHCAEDL